MKDRNPTTGDIVSMVVLLAGMIGYVMNFQNLFQYAADSREFIVSAIGCFIPPLGSFTGFIW